MTKTLERHVYDFIPRPGRYVSDIRVHFALTADLDLLQEALDELTVRGFIRRAGCHLRPMYVRMKSPTVFYQTTTQENRDGRPSIQPAHGAEPAPAGV